MSLLTVENVSHNFGGRTLFNDVSFRLLAGEHIGLVGANGVGKSTLMNILTGKLLKDSGKVEWTPRVRYGYLDQHTLLTPGKTIRDVLKDAFLPMLELEKELMVITDKMGEALQKNSKFYWRRWAISRNSWIWAIFI
ncbi:ABC transporter ATP-binding protein [Paenibacillus pini JCM 16418]|uniref:ABC transporter ATP-binding protein n=1 Tax=Paenibacillus pini JCM 16418 TaxID=1236976 RepID=W7YGC1_9BACL|nr:ABC transporter ATP-binding protein [Paenibacillus pini JCM 16418]